MKVNKSQPSFGMALNTEGFKYIAKYGTEAEIKASTSSVPRLKQLAEDVELYPRLAPAGFLWMKQRWEVTASKTNKTFFEKVLHAMGWSKSVTKESPTEYPSRLRYSCGDADIEGASVDLVRAATEAKEAYLLALAEKATRENPKSARDIAAKQLFDAIDEASKVE